MEKILINEYFDISLFGLGLLGIILFGMNGLLFEMIVYGNIVLIIKIIREYYIWKNGEKENE